MRLEGNADRFGGFADLYDAVRPTPPRELADLLTAYVPSPEPPRVVDLGSGSGLSTRWCATWAAQVTGVEPNADMRHQAERATDSANVEYVDGWAHDTGLLDAVADIVVVVQALHWMDPGPTFDEIARVLRPGGVFAAIDCDWPPAVGDADAERAWLRCRAISKAGERLLRAGAAGDALRAALGELDDEALLVDTDSHVDRLPALSVRVWPKEQHLERMRASGHFRWCREVAFHSVEMSDANRFVDLLRSQGDFQTLLKYGATEEDLGVSRLRDVARQSLGTEPRPMWFTYRARIAGLEL